MYTGSEKPYFGGNIFSDPIELFTDSDTIFHCLTRIYENVNKREDRKTLPCFFLILLFLYLFRHGFNFRRVTKTEHRFFEDVLYK